jgi:hypothetical protein
VIGLPGFIDYFLGEKTVIGVLSALVGAIVILSAVLIRWLLMQPPFTVLNTEKTLIFEDERGHKASHIDVRTVRANHKGLSEYWFKELGRPDALDNLRIDDQPPDMSQQIAMMVRRVPRKHECIFA